MDFLDELKWRGMIQDMTPDLREHLSRGTVRGYIGFDPTAESLGIGNFVQLQLLTLFQRSGHQPVILMGGATGLIGDPSGKDEERLLKSRKEIKSNIKKQIEQVHRLMDFNTENNPPILLDNLNFYTHIDMFTYLRDIGKLLTVNYMLNKESVKSRMKKGISYTEFSYQLIQGYDFVRMCKDYNCRFQMGGSDQWGNITTGIEMIRKVQGIDAYGLTTPLLERSDGKKFGKTEGGNIWLDPEMTSPYQFYQFWINTDDADIEKYIRFFSLKSIEEMSDMISGIKEDPQGVKAELATELTTRVHDEEQANAVREVSEMLFNRKLNKERLQKISKEAWRSISNELPNYHITDENLLDDPLESLLTNTAFVFQSKSELRRAVKNNSLALNKKKISSIDARISRSDFFYDRYAMLEKGKKNKYILILG